MSGKIDLKVLAVMSLPCKQYIPHVHTLDVLPSDNRTRSYHFSCSKPQQYKIAKYCEELLGDYLLTKPLDNVPVSNQM